MGHLLNFLIYNPHAPPTATKIMKTPNKQPDDNPLPPSLVTSFPAFDIVVLGAII